MKNLIVSGTTDLVTGVLPVNVAKEQLNLIDENNQLRIENAKDIRQVEIFSVNGKLVQSINNASSKIEIGTTGFEQGVYILKAKTDSGIQSAKFIK